MSDKERRRLPSLRRGLNFDVRTRAGPQNGEAFCGEYLPWPTSNMHALGVLSAEVSWRREPGINRAYVWLSDGTVAGYRDLDTGADHPTSHQHSGLISGVLAEWLQSQGVPCVGFPQEPRLPAVPSGGGLSGWFARRRARREYARAVSSYRDWRLDHPSWKVPVDPPHGGWRDLVRNEPGRALWQHAAQLPPARFFDLPARHEARAWSKGALREEVVASELWRIARPGAWRYVHSVPVGTRGSDIDHVLVGPGGVFTINTKAHRDANVWVGGNTLLVNGHKQPYLRNSRHEAARASRLLSAATGLTVTARGVIVLVDPRHLTIRNVPPDVTITTRYGLKRWASDLPPVLSEEQVEAIFNQVRRSATWT